jgi:hypothetical protein
MKRIILLVMLLASTARASWGDLKEGLDPKAAEQMVGAPLFENRSRGWTFVNWVYDNGGSILFENGRVKFWQAPQGAAPARPLVVVASTPAAVPAAPAPAVARVAPAAVGHHPVLKIRR